MGERATAIGRGVVIQVAARVAALGMSLVTIATSTRYLGIDQYGLLVATIVFVGVFESVANLGVDEVVTRRISQGRGTLGHLAGVQLGFTLLYGPLLAVMAVLAGLVVHAGDPTLQIAIAIIASGLVFISVGSAATPVFQTRVRFGGAALADLLSRGLTLGATVAVAATDSGVLAMAAVQVIPPLVSMIVSLVAANRMERLRPRFEWRLTVSLVRESIPLTLILVVAIFYWRADGLLLSVLSTAAEVGAYGLALAIASNLSMIPQVFAQTSLSTFAERRHRDPEGFNRSVRVAMQIVIAILLPVAVLGPPLAEDIITLLSTSEFAERGTTVLQLFFVAIALGFLNPILSMALFSAGRQQFLLRMALVTLTVNIGLNVALIPSLGAVGSGIALIASEVLGVTASTWVLAREGARPPGVLDIARAVPGLAAGLGLIWLLRDAPFLVTAVAAGVAYAALALATGAMPVAVVRSLFRRGGGGDDGDDGGGGPDGPDGGPDGPGPDAADDDAETRPLGPVDGPTRTIGPVDGPTRPIPLPAEQATQPLRVPDGR